MLGSALIRAGVIQNIEQVNSLYDALKTDAQREEFKRLQDKEILSDKFKSLKWWEFVNSIFFALGAFSDIH